MIDTSQRSIGLGVTCFATILTLVTLAFGQTADDHAAHHPAPGEASPAPAQGAMGGTQTPGAGGGGMGAEMGDMMKQMGVPPPKELYPSLMALPDQVTPEERARIEQLADEHMKTGAALLSSGLDKLTTSTSDRDYVAMQQATAQMREGLARFESGIAARRVLLEGKAPRNLALDWFKREMNLASPVRPEEPRGLLGVTPFHLFTMALLIGFALAMVAMYFFKMRRAAALFGRLPPDTKPPPPGSSPPLAGGPGPAATSAPPAASQAAQASPLTTNWRGQLRVGSIVAETPSVKTIRLLPSSAEPFLPFTFVPGQFLNVAFWIGGAKMNRSYSFSSSPTEREYVELTVRREPRGAVSRHIDDLLKVGDEIEAGGPVGRFTFAGTEADSVVLIAGGVGITPMMSIARYLTE